MGYGNAAPGFLGRAALLFRDNPFGFCRFAGFAGAAVFWRYGGFNNQGDQAIAGVLAVKLLGAMGAGRNHEVPLLGHASPGKGFQTQINGVWQGLAATRMKAELDGRCRLVDLLPTGTRGADELLLDVVVV